MRAGKGRGGAGPTKKSEAVVDHNSNCKTPGTKPQGTRLLRIIAELFRNKIPQTNASKRRERLRRPNQKEQTSG